MSAESPTVVEVTISEFELAEAKELARARLEESSRRRSPDRPTARNTPAQIRGAVGEIAAARWLQDEGCEVDRGFEADADEPDIRANGAGLEVMTAQISHREVTGFCVPPNKLWAARQRRAAGYLFVGTDDSAEPTTVWVQAFARVDDVDLDEPRHTSVRPGSFSVLNHVVRPELLMTPAELVRVLATGPTSEGWAG